MNSPVRQYQQLDITTAVDGASSHQLIDLLFQGAKERLRQAQGCIMRQDHEGRGRAINACVDIVEGLQASLDHEKGGEIAGNLDSLYDYMQRRLFRANADDDLQGVREVEDLINTLREAWQAIESN